MSVYCFLWVLETRTSSKKSVMGLLAFALISADPSGARPTFMMNGTIAQLGRTEGWGIFSLLIALRGVPNKTVN